MKIGEKIKGVRRLLNISQEDLSDQVGVSLKTVQRWEAGVRSPRVQELQKLSKVLNIPVGELANEDNVSDVDITSIVKGVSSPEYLEKGVNYSEQSVFSDMEYWGDVVERASGVAMRRNKQEIAGVIKMLNLALNSLVTITKLLDVADKNKMSPLIDEEIQKINQSTTPIQNISAYNGDNSVYKDNVFNNGIDLLEKKL